MAETLLQGFKRFRKETYEGRSPLMPRLVEEGQFPEYFIISCIDSRSNPGTIFRPAPGTFLAHKAMGAIVRPYKQGTALAAALEFAIDHNNIKEIVILGHTDCGAIKALIEGIDAREITSFLEVAQSGLQKAKTQCGTNCTAGRLSRLTEEQIVLQSVANLEGYPSVANALNEKRMTIRAWLFDMQSGNLFEHKQSSGQFEPITEYETEETEEKTGVQG
jgi:carbonic anhydrase